MTGIHSAVMDHIQAALQAALIDGIPDDDPARAGHVGQGPLQGSPDPDQARISVTLHEADPDAFYTGLLTSLTGPWADEVGEVECGGAATWKRRFTVKARCLLVDTQEELREARLVASAVRRRIERALLDLPFAGVASEGEYVARGVVSTGMRGETLQAGGPGAYDFHIKIRFEVETTARILGETL